MSIKIKIGKIWLKNAFCDFKLFYKFKFEDYGEINIFLRKHFENFVMLK